MLNYSLKAGFLCNQTLPAHRNSSQLSTLLLVISGLNVALSITATLGNALIFAALHKESSLNPPSKLFLRCLAFSDLCVGLVVQPLAVVSLLAAFYHRWKFCRVAELLWYSFSIVMADFSLATLSAISVDRLLALSLVVRYKKVVTVKRARWFLAMFLLLSFGNYVTQYVLNFFAFLVYSAYMWMSLLITSIYCYARIYLALRNHIQAHVIPQSQPNGISPLNLSRYKKTVSTALCLFAALIICYLPFGLVLFVETMLSQITEPVVITVYFGITLVYLNSTLNPLLYCWKIREVRHVVMKILRNLGFGKLFGDRRKKRLEQGTSGIVHDEKLIPNFKSHRQTSSSGSSLQRFSKWPLVERRPILQLTILEDGEDPG